MSYNISSIEIIGGDGLFVAKSEVVSPEFSPEAWADFQANMSGYAEEVAPGLWRFKLIPWFGEGSGCTDWFMEFLARTYGSADLLLCWEGGDRYTGLRVVNGKVTEHDVVMTLGEES